MLVVGCALRDGTGMNVAAGPELAAAVTNAGGLGVIGGVGYTPKVLRSQVGLAWCWMLDK